MKPFLSFDSNFCIVQRGFDHNTEKHYEGMFTQGSGYFHLRGSYEEGLPGAKQDEEYMRLPTNVTVEKTRQPLSKWGTYLPGVTGVHPLLREELVNLPYPAYLAVSAGGEVLAMDGTGVSAYVRWLDLRDGVLYRRFRWATSQGEVLDCFYRRYISKSRRNLLVQEMCYKAVEGNCLITFESGISCGVRTNGYQHVTAVHTAVAGNCTEVEVTTDNGDVVRLCSAAECSRGEFCVQGEELKAAAWAAAGETVTVRKYTLLSCSRDSDGGATMQCLRRELAKLLAVGECCYPAHAKQWADRWSEAAIVIEGDQEAQLAVNFAVYHLLRSVNREDGRVAICAKGYAGEAYFGHFFWDTELYLLPFFLDTDQAAAKRLVEFRIRTLAGAMENAKSYGYPGARYPWEASVSGLEQCPNWQYADNEIHVTADVTFGLWSYCRAFGDAAFRRSITPVFVETARYWLARVERRADGKINLNGVMGPDEYICLCNNNAYTNAMVSLSLLRTVELAEQWEQEDPAFAASLGIAAAELADMRRVAKALPIAVDSNGIIAQCDEFAKLEEPCFATSWTDRSRPYAGVVSQERNYRTKALKQADVLLLPYLFPERFTAEQLQQNYDYYLPYTTHDSSLSAIIHSILCCRLGRKEEAEVLFRRALSIDIGGGAGEGIHIANCGGIWQAVVQGFAGMRPGTNGGAPTFCPNMPNHWHRLCFSVLSGEKRYRVEIVGDVATVSKIGG